MKQAQNVLSLILVIFIGALAFARELRHARQTPAAGTDASNNGGGDSGRKRRRGAAATAGTVRSATSRAARWPRRPS